MSPTLIQHSNLSCAWAKAFVSVFEHQKHGTLVVNITGFVGEMPREDPALAGALDALLRERDKTFTIRQTAMSIFPQESWERLDRPSVGPLTDYYVKKMLPRLHALHRNNHRGTYFQRMVSFGAGAQGAGGTAGFNQLAHIIDIWKRDRGHGSSSRESAMQVAILDPAEDHTGSPLQVFPCLQQVGFSVGEDDRLTVVGFYPSQYLVERAYGNYRGLCQLGYFMAREMGLRFGGLTCFVAHPLRGNTPKGDLRRLYSQAKALADLADEPS